MPSELLRFRRFAAASVVAVSLAGPTGRFWTGGLQELAQAVLEFDPDR